MAEGDEEEDDGFYDNQKSKESGDDQESRDSEDADTPVDDE